MSRSETLSRLIKNLSITTPDVEAAAVIDNDGLVIASALPADVDDDAVAAMAAALLGIGERIVAELRRGNFEVVMIRGDLGYLILTRSGPDSVLAILATKSAKLGLIFLDAARTAKEIARTLA
jgi:predicted regulator of Ras-like GTPase activity (Roadblock/LC7/MglB family)